MNTFRKCGKIRKSDKVRFDDGREHYGEQIGESHKWTQGAAQEINPIVKTRGNEW